LITTKVIYILAKNCF